MIWAFHSESQELLMSASLAACQGKLTWNDARALGVFLWLNSVESMVRKASTRNSPHYLSNGLAEIVHGSHRSDRIHGWGFPRSSCQFPFLLRSGETQIGSGTLAASSMAQGAGSHVTIHV
jgi:hypothetical protein